MTNTAVTGGVRMPVQPQHFRPVRRWCSISGEMCYNSGEAISEIECPEISSTLVTTGEVTPQRHLEMAYANLGAGLNGSWNEGGEE